MKKLLAALVITALCGLPLKAQTTAAPQIFFNAAVSTTVLTVKNVPGTIYGFSLTNNAAAAQCFLQIFNTTAGNVTLGTTVPVASIGLGAALTTTGPFGPTQLNSAISVAATATAAGSGACTSAMTVNLLYL